MTSMRFALGRKRRLPGLTVKDGYMRHPFDVQNGVETSGLVHGRDLKTGHLHDRHSTAYYGIAPSVLRTLIERWRAGSLAAPPEDYSFLDLGAGMGRAMLVAAEMPFREVVGVELHPELAAVAEENIQKWNAAHRARCPMRIVCQDAAAFRFPANPCVAFLFNPFREPMLRALLRHVEREFLKRPGQLDLIYANDEHADIFAADRRFERLWTGPVPLSEEDHLADREILLAQPNGEYTWSTEEPSSIYRYVGKPRVAPQVGIL
jgi:SAM-dependent methyltransferase